MGNAFDLTEMWKRVLLRSTKMGFKQDPGKAEIGDEYFFWSWESADNWRDRLPKTHSGKVTKEPCDSDRYGQWKVRINFGRIIR